VYKKIFVYTNTNCRRRLLDTKKLKLYFKKNNYKVIDSAKTADLIVYVTCAYRNEITEECLQKIIEFQHYDADLIVAGCLPKIEEARLLEIFQGVTLCTKNINDIDKLFSKNTISFSTITDSEAIVADQSSSLRNAAQNLRDSLHKLSCSIGKFFVEHTVHPHLPVYLYPSNPEFYHVRISWGCKGNCSYCGIKKAIGNLKSKPLQECIDDFKEGIGNGYSHFIITADDVGAYGTDIGLYFPDLLAELLLIPGNYKISLQDFDPKWVVRYIDSFEKLTDQSKIASINIAFQSGSKNVLKLMNRYSDTKKIKEALLRIKKWNPTLSLDSHFIIGFPGESHEDFIQTMDTIIALDFDMGFLYRYSCKTGTKAENMEPKISLEEKNRRMREASTFLQDHNYEVLSLSKDSFYAFYKK